MSPKAGSEVIPDSEDERSKGQGKLPVVTRKIPQVVEISSDEENGPPKASSSKVQIPKVVPVTPKSNRTIRYVHAHKPVSVSSSDSEEEENKNEQPTKEEDALLYSPIKASHTREVIDLTTTCYEEEKAEEDEVFDELIFGDEDWLKKKTVGLVQLPPKLKLKGAIPLSNFPEEDELWNDDEEYVTSRAKAHCPYYSQPSSG
ncbi:hypothetical protein BDY19DRAFT_99354 [Irpex rosettiformis]|uniref:Uncharacterized protein n=1 Tax=Irpex rosettiformis TaxID=378272 RepID=A0ACB8U7E3_9APHY|nr:hypothetical protein BDY19DRAFT_99354 [Irpex rosettiformis]